MSQPCRKGPEEGLGATQDLGLNTSGNQIAPRDNREGKVAISAAENFFLP